MRGEEGRKADFLWNSKIFSALASHRLALYSPSYESVGA